MKPGPCTVRNGSYNCQLPAGHTGRHACVFRSHRAGAGFWKPNAKILATWVDGYSTIRFKAAKP